MEIKKLACELESWAQEKGWKTVNGIWVNFDWESYRGNVSHLRPVK